MPDGQPATTGVEEDSVAVVLVVAVDTSEAEVQGPQAVEEVSVGQDPVVVRVTTTAEACVPRICVPGSFVLRFIDRPPWRDRIAG
jgi:hypothetical protein